MPSLGIVSLFTRLVVTLLASLGSVAIDSLPPIDRLDGSSDRI